MTTISSLSQLGWTGFFQQQLSLDEFEHYTAARIVAEHRSGFDIISLDGTRYLQKHHQMPVLTTGDWILLDQQQQFYRALDRSSVFSRKAAGKAAAEQLIAANVDTLFIVSSLNADFNLNRLERYLALAKEADVEAVVLLSKADCCDNRDSYIAQVQALDPLLMVFALNMLDSQSVQQLQAWSKPGRTLALLGSSGVGKSTLTNQLLATDAQATAEIREQDSKGRHTTTARSLHFAASGAVILDTPGMRELQLSDCEQGVQQTFSDITELAEQCRYADCQHNGEPGCAIQQAIEQGRLDQRRLSNYFKLLREQAFNSASLAEKRAKDRSFSRMVRTVMSESRHRKLNG